MDGGWARFDDAATGVSRVFRRADEVFVARRPDEVEPVLRAVGRATSGGAWAFGFIAYEAASGLDGGLPTSAVRGAGPLAWFGVTTTAPTADPLSTSRGYRALGWRLDGGAAWHETAVEQVRARIAAGETYQVNLTTQLRAAFDGEPLALYADLVRAQPTPYGAYLDLGDRAVASASPELFFAWSGERLLTRPMKGTAARGVTPALDDEARRRLATSTKERAENVIVVDLLRNDLSRVAELGTVRVPRLCAVEAYPTVWQLTSDVVARVPSSTTLLDVLRVLFPCGSVTGAPKRRTMQVITDVEQGPRDVYCGAIGWVAPSTHAHRARFSVAIRTVVLEGTAGSASYGTGSAITWASQAAAEYDEIVLKTAMLQGLPAAAPLAG